MDLLQRPTGSRSPGVGGLLLLLLCEYPFPRRSAASPAEGLPRFPDGRFLPGGSLEQGGGQPAKGPRFRRRRRDRLNPLPPPPQRRTEGLGEGNSPRPSRGTFRPGWSWLAGRDGTGREASFSDGENNSEARFPPSLPPSAGPAAPGCPDSLLSLAPRPGCRGPGRGGGGSARGGGPLGPVIQPGEGDLRRAGERDHLPSG